MFFLEIIHVLFIDYTCFFIDYTCEEDCKMDQPKQHKKGIQTKPNFFY